MCYGVKAKKENVTIEGNKFLWACQLLFCAGHKKM